MIEVRYPLLSQLYSSSLSKSSLTVAPDSICDAISFLSAATSSSFFSTGFAVLDGVGAADGAGSSDGVRDDAGFCVDNAGGIGFVGDLVVFGFVVDPGVLVPGFAGVFGCDGMFVVVGVFFLEAAFTLILQTNFLLPIFACNFAVPFFFPLIMTVLPFFLAEKEIHFLPAIAFQVIFFLAFFTFRVLDLPTVMVSVFLLRLGALAAFTVFAEMFPANNMEMDRIPAIHFLERVDFIVFSLSFCAMIYILRKETNMTRNGSITLLYDCVRMN